MAFLAGCWLGSTLVGLAFSWAVYKGNWREKPAESWYCGCGHNNGINLYKCAACSRDPKGEHQP